MLTLEQALTLLKRMQAAAPHPTAAKLNDISELLLSLSKDNQYLAGLYGEAMAQPVPDGANGESAAVPTNRGEQDAAEEAKAADILMLQFSEALKPRLQAAHDCLEPLLNQAYGRLTETQAEALEHMRQQMMAGLDLFDMLEDMIALRHGLLDVTPLVFSPSILMHEAERQAQAFIQQRGQTLEVTYPDPDWSAEGDYRRILVILTDLLDNASRYTAQGGSIRLTAEHVGTHVLFSVTDSGIGLRPEDMDHVGEPFWRATDQPLVVRHPGSGLRLYLARKILKLFQGELIFSGEPGIGSTFSFTLPAAQ